MADIDDVDRRILNAIQEDGKLSLQELADKCLSTTATCWRRLNNLEQSGLVLGYHAIVDRKKLGYSICAFVNLSIEHQYKKFTPEIASQIEAREEVMECYATTGDSDFTFRVIAKDIDTYNLFIQEFLFTLPGVSNVRSSIALREIKQTTRVPV